MPTRDPTDNKISTQFFNEMFKWAEFLFILVIIFAILGIFFILLDWIRYYLFGHKGEQYDDQGELNQEPENRLESDWDDEK